MSHRQTGTPPQRVGNTTLRQTGEANHRSPATLPATTQDLAKYHVPERVRLRLDRDKNTVRGEKLPQIRESAGVELQSRTGVYRQDYVEGGLVQRFSPILR